MSSFVYKLKHFSIGDPYQQYLQAFIEVWFTAEQKNALSTNFSQLTFLS